MLERKPPRPVFFVALGGVIVAAVIIIPRVGHFDPGDAAAVRVFTSEPIRVELSSAPDLAEAIAATKAALLAAAADAPGVLAAELRDIAADDAYLEDMSSRALARLHNDAAALAFASHSVRGEGDRVTIITVTIELLPTGHFDAISRDHEDGHAFINSRLSESCGAAVVAAEVATGKTGDALITGIIEHLRLLEVQAHSQYHQESTDGVIGSHRAAAERAVAQVIGDGCRAR